MERPLSDVDARDSDLLGEDLGELPLRLLELLGLRSRTTTTTTEPSLGPFPMPKSSSTVSGGGASSNTSTVPASNFKLKNPDCKIDSSEPKAKFITRSYRYRYRTKDGKTHKFIEKRKFQLRPVYYVQWFETPKGTIQYVRIRKYKLPLISKFSSSKRGSGKEGRTRFLRKIRRRSGRRVSEDSGSNECDIVEFNELDKSAFFAKFKDSSKKNVNFRTWKQSHEDSDIDNEFVQESYSASSGNSDLEVMIFEDMETGTRQEIEGIEEGSEPNTSNPPKFPDEGQFEEIEDVFSEEEDGDDLTKDAAAFSETEQASSGGESSSTIGKNSSNGKAEVNDGSGASRGGKTKSTTSKGGSESPGKGNSTSSNKSGGKTSGAPINGGRSLRKGKVSKGGRKDIPGDSDVSSGPSNEGSTKIWSEFSDGSPMEEDEDETTYLEEVDEEYEDEDESGVDLTEPTKSSSRTGKNSSKGKAAGEKASGASKGGKIQAPSTSKGGSKSSARGNSTSSSKTGGKISGATKRKASKGRRKANPSDSDVSSGPSDGGKTKTWSEFHDASGSPVEEDDDEITYLDEVDDEDEDESGGDMTEPTKSSSTTGKNSSKGKAAGEKASGASKGGKIQAPSTSKGGSKSSARGNSTSSSKTGGKISGATKRKASKGRRKANPSDSDVSSGPSDGGKTKTRSKFHDASGSPVEEGEDEITYLDEADDQDEDVSGGDMTKPGKSNSLTGRDGEDEDLDGRTASDGKKMSTNDVRKIRYKNGSRRSPSGSKFVLRKSHHGKTSRDEPVVVEEPEDYHEDDYEEDQEHLVTGTSATLQSTKASKNDSPNGDTLYEYYTDDEPRVTTRNVQASKGINDESDYEIYDDGEPDIDHQGTVTTSRKYYHVPGHHLSGQVYSSGSHHRNRRPHGGSRTYIESYVYPSEEGRGSDTGNRKTKIVSSPDDKDDLYTSDGEKVDRSKVAKRNEGDSESNGKLNTPEGARRIVRTRKSKTGSGYEKDGDLTTPEGARRVVRTRHSRTGSAYRNDGDLTTPEGARRVVRRRKSRTGSGYDNDGDLTTPEGARRVVRRRKSRTGNGSERGDDLATPVGAKRVVRTKKKTESNDYDSYAPEGARRVVKKNKTSTKGGSENYDDLSTPEGAREAWTTNTRTEGVLGDHRRSANGTGQETNNNGGSETRKKGYWVWRARNGTVIESSRPEVQNVQVNNGTVMTPPRPDTLNKTNGTATATAPTPSSGLAGENIAKQKDEAVKTKDGSIAT